MNPTKEEMEERRKVRAAFYNIATELQKRGERYLDTGEPTGTLLSDYGPADFVERMVMAELIVRRLFSK